MLFLSLHEQNYLELVASFQYILNLTYVVRIMTFSAPSNLTNFIYINLRHQVQWASTERACQIWINTNVNHIIL